MMQKLEGAALAKWAREQKPTKALVDELAAEIERLTVKPVTSWEGVWGQFDQSGRTTQFQ